MSKKAAADPSKNRKNRRLNPYFFVSYWSLRLTLLGDWVDRC
ncbi:hypothetical protein [Aeoliella sp.]